MDKDDITRGIEAFTKMLDEPGEEAEIRQLTHTLITVGMRACEAAMRALTDTVDTQGRRDGNQRS